MDRSTALRLASATVLIAGLAAAVMIYIHASRAAAPGGLDDDQTLETKQYLRQMEVYGGKANVLASEVRAWLAALWHGKRLAFTVACLTLAASGILRLAATPLPPLSDEDRRRGRRPGNAGG